MASATGERIDALEAAARLMDGFVHETGVTGSAPPRRYLWTDAFAVCNLLELHRSGVAPPDPAEGYRALALKLVGQVHHVLGRHRADDPRQGWLSGLQEVEGEGHPTAGGLRIGKPLPDRAPHEPVDPRLEWDRDGQYFHYLTRWMHALLRASEEGAGDRRILEWAVELARVSHARFLRGADRGRTGHLAWKMSVDLSRPVVEGQGHHDPLDGYITFQALAARVRRRDPGRRVLDEEIRSLGALTWESGEHGWATPDPLGLGGLMTDLLRVTRLIRVGEEGLDPLVPVLLDAISAGLGDYLRSRPLRMPPEARLPFRELGLAIGIEALARVADEPDHGPWIRWRLPPLSEVGQLAADILDGWLAPATRSLPCWTDHGDINAVMLATALAPRGYLGE